MFSLIAAAGIVYWQSGAPIPDLLRADESLTPIHGNAIIYSDDGGDVPIENVASGVTIAAKPGTLVRVLTDSDFYTNRTPERIIGVQTLDERRFMGRMQRKYVRPR
jgi:hypothetical protein